MSIKIMKLSTGEEIIADVISQTEDTITVQDTLAIMLKPANDGFTYGFIPWVPMVEGDKEISLAHVVFLGDPAEDARNAYANMFGKIITPEKKIII
jgi:hypothetical protein